MPIDAAIRDIIKHNGHITIDDMMRHVLSMHAESYYKKTKYLGKQGDFITSPEISQLFGETIALWVIEQWQNIGKPKDFALVELGPGVGTLMRDVLKTSQIAPDFFKAARVYLYDINVNFIKQQRRKLNIFNKNIQWIQNIKKLPQLPMIIIANEFFDSLPIKQFLKIKDRWFESVLILDPVDGLIKYSTITVNNNLYAHLMLSHSQAQDGAIIEESIESLKIVKMLSKLISRYKGSALIIDYGYNIGTHDRQRKQYNSTLQAIKDHRYQPIIDTLGEADLTAHVDFNALTLAAKSLGIKRLQVSTQGAFLQKYGIEFRCQMLKNNLSDHEAEILDNQLFRLTNTTQMGELFKTLEMFEY